jgi:hypothetical protein
MKTTRKTERQKIARAVKTARKETERKVRKKLLKADKAKVARVLKAGKAKINRLLKANNARVAKKIRENSVRLTDVLKGVKHRPKPKRQPIDNPFDLRRFRGNRKKETFEQRLKRVEGNVHTVRDKILFGIAGGAYRFQWKSIAKECGYRTGERKKMLSVLDNKGYTINGLAHHIWEENDGSYGHGPSDDVIRDQIIDVLQSVSSRTDALNQLDRGQGNTPF